jgi:hypothetical protein
LTAAAAAEGGDDNDPIATWGLSRARGERGDWDRRDAGNDDEREQQQQQQRIESFIIYFLANIFVTRASKSLALLCIMNCTRFSITARRHRAPQHLWHQ